MPEEFKPVSGRKLCIIALACVVLGVLAYAWRFASVLDIRAEDWQARCFLTALYPHLTAYKQSHGQWPTKASLRDEGDIALRDCDGHLFSGENLDSLWRDCMIIAATGEQAPLACLPSQEMFQGQPVFVVLKASGSVERLTRGEQPDLP